MLHSHASLYFIKVQFFFFTKDFEQILRQLFPQSTNFLFFMMKERYNFTRLT